ncbi:MAG: hypothetical protein EXR71_07085 [Myxococcales bacterium]|nr:hypothetical protein [Myxococcales bacterium]
MAHAQLTPDELAFLHEVDGTGPARAEVLALRELGSSLRGAVCGGVDVADDVMLSVSLQDAVGAGVDVADDVMLSLAVLDAVGGGVDVADDVMFTLGLQGAVAGGVDVADAVMATIPRSTMPRWASLGGYGAAVAMAAALLFALQGGWGEPSAPVVVLAEAPAPSILLASFNEASVEALDTPDGASVSVMQYEEGGPTIIFVTEAEG